MGKGTSREQIEDFIRERFLGRRAQFRIATRSWSVDGAPSTAGQISRMIAGILDCAQSRVINQLENLQHQLILEHEKALQRWCFQNDALPRCQAELNRYLSLLERKDTDLKQQQANRAALRQWLWQVKRGIVRKEARWHVALVFHCKENGTGKSYNVQRLLKPVEPYTRNMKVNDLGEKFGGFMLSNTLVAFLDEFAGADSICASNLKAILTGRPWDQRAMYSDTGFYADNRTSAIATSNLDPPHGFVDTSGARRFWSIHCDGTSMEQDVERMSRFDDLDVGKIWAAVSSSDRAPHELTDPTVLAYMSEIRDHTLRSKTSLELFLEEGTEQTELTFKLPMKEFQQSYSRYCHETKQPIQRAGYKKIGQALTNLGCTVVNHGNSIYIRGRCLASLESH